MSVNLSNPTTDIKNILAINGINIGVTSAEIRKKNRDDLCVFSFSGASVAGVFTQNRCCAAPVIICRKHLADNQSQNNINGLLINSGCANAATGDAGLADANSTCAELGRLIGCQSDNILPFSTGVILERLPMDRMLSGINNAHKNLAPANPEKWLQAARAIMTTDVVAKIYSAQNTQYKVTGIAKGAGMIHPNMATMLGFVATDAKVKPAVLQQMIAEIADESFNAITVDGDTSTNDSFILIATNQVGDEIDSKNHPQYQEVFSLILQVSTKLAQAIVRDGEGASKFVTINVLGGKTINEAKQVAEKIALSPLVKTAFFASDPNLGRILAAIGNSGIADLDITKVSLIIGSSHTGENILVAENGGRAKSYTADAEKATLKIMQSDEFYLEIGVNRGNASAKKFTCDLGYEYVKINAEYRT